MFFFFLNPPIKLPKILPSDPAFDLIITLPDSQVFYVQKALLSEQGKFFQPFLSMRGLSQISLNKEIGPSKIISRLFHAFYGEEVSFLLEELMDLDRVLDNFDCKKAKDALKANLREAILKTEDIEFFFKVFEHFAIRDHKKFCKEAVRKLNDKGFFSKIERGLEENDLKVLSFLKVLSERGFIKFLALLLADEMRKRGGEKSKAFLLAILEKCISFYCSFIIIRSDKTELLLQDFSLELNPSEKKYLEPDIIKTFQGEIQQLKKTNQSLNNQIQGLRGKESESKARFLQVLRRVERLERGLEVEAEEHHNHIYNNNLDKQHNANKDNQQNNKENPNNNKDNEQSKENQNINKNKEISNIINDIGINRNTTSNFISTPKEKRNKFDTYLANEEYKKSKPIKKKLIKKEEQQPAKKNIDSLNKKPKSPFGLFTSEKELHLVLDLIKKSFIDKNIGFVRLYEASKQNFQLKSLKEVFLKEKTLLLILIQTDKDKVLGACFKTNNQINYNNRDILFILNPMKLRTLKQPLIIGFKEEEISLGKELVVKNDGNTNLNMIEIEENGLFESFLMKEMMVLEAKIEL